MIPLQQVGPLGYIYAPPQVTGSIDALPAIPHFAAEAVMRIQGINAVRDSVVYIGLEADGQFTPLGTGFIVSRVYGENYVFSFVATAAHVLKSIKGDTIYVRLNRKSGDAASIPIPAESAVEWKENDLALIPLNIGTDVYDYKMLELDETALAKAREASQHVQIKNKYATSSAFFTRIFSTNGKGRHGVKQ